MSKAEIDRFVSDVRGNRALLQDISDGIIGLGHFVDKAKQRGYRFTVEEAKTYIRERHGAAVSDEQLEAVVGGGSTDVSASAEVVTTVEVSLAVNTTNVNGEAGVAAVAVGVIVAS